MVLFAVYTYIIAVRISEDIGKREEAKEAKRKWEQRGREGQKGAELAYISAVFLFML